MPSNELPPLTHTELRSLGLTLHTYPQDGTWGYVVRDDHGTDHAAGWGLEDPHQAQRVALMDAQTRPSVEALRLAARAAA